MANQHVPKVISIDDKERKNIPIEKHDYPINNIPMARACHVDAFNPAAFGLSHVDSPFRCAMLSAPWPSRTNNIFPRNAKQNNSHIIYIALKTLSLYIFTRQISTASIMYHILTAILYEMLSGQSDE